MLMAEYEKEVLPELQVAYSRYCQAVEAVAALRQKAQAPAAQIEQMAKGQGFNMVLPSLFLDFLNLIVSKTCMFLSLNFLLTVASFLWAPNLFIAPLQTGAFYPPNVSYLISWVLSQ